MFAHPSYTQSLWTPDQFKRIWTVIKNFDAAHAKSGSVRVKVKYNDQDFRKQLPVSSEVLDVLAQVADFMASDAVLKKSFSEDEFQAAFHAKVSPAPTSLSDLALACQVTAREPAHYQNDCKFAAAMCRKADPTLTYWCSLCDWQSDEAGEFLKHERSRGRDFQV